MVLDDEPFILKLHSHMLAEMGFVNSTTFEQGALALAAIDQGAPPDLILLDLSMPRMDGIEFIRHLMKRGFAGSLILVSGEDERLLQTAERLVRAHGIAVLGHLTKPVKPATLGAMLEAWEGQSGYIRRLRTKTYSVEEVKNAVENDQLVNHYQPKVSLKTGEVIGVECLSRWQHPADGLVLPDRFISVAEKGGAIEALTRSTFTRAMSEIRALEDGGFPVQVAINLAAATLSSLDFADFAAATAQQASVRPHNVVLEVTESQLIKDLRAPLEVLTRLRLMRFTLSIDDFGTGYSSLSQLQTIPFDELKIDQTFVHRASEDATARAIYDASLGLAKQLNMTTVAEGVETQADWDLVQSTGCDEAQGYFIARPMSAQDLGIWRDEWRVRARTDLGFA